MKNFDINNLKKLEHVERYFSFLDKLIETLKSQENKVKSPCL